MGGAGRLRAMPLAPDADSAAAEKQDSGACQDDEKGGRTRAEIEGRADGGWFRRGGGGVRLEEALRSIALDEVLQRRPVLAGLLELCFRSLRDGHGLRARSAARGVSCIAARCLAAATRLQAFAVDLLRRRFSAASGECGLRHAEKNCGCYGYSC